MMQKLCQRDPLWASNKIGKTNLTVGRFGCTLTCISMIDSYFEKVYKLPGYLAKYLDFTPGGLIIWGSLSRELPFVLRDRFQGFQKQKIDQALRLDNMACILEVDHSHWILATRLIPFTNTYMIVDPWDGKIKTTMAYKNRITGGATFILEHS